MYKVLLADDEIHVCQLIQYLVDWQGLGLELVAIASSGVDAFEQIVTQEPDIVISDIRMSGFSGIDLMEKVRGLGKDCRFVLISGYRQFEYAQKAIQYGVIDYVVKPIKKNELEAALQKAIRDLERKRRPDPAAAVPSPAEDTARYRRDRLAADIQNGVLLLQDATPHRLREAYGMDFSGACYAMDWRFLCHGAYSDETFRMLEGKVAIWIEHQGELWFQDFVLLRDSSSLLLICVAAQDENLPGFHLIREECQAVISIFSGWEAVVGISPLAEGQALDVPARAAQRACEEYLFDAGQNLHYSSDAARSVDDFHAVIGFDACARLVSAMQILDADAVCELLRDAFRIFQSQPQVSARAVFGYIDWVLGEINHSLSAFNSGEDSAAHYLDRTGLLHELAHLSSVGLVGSRLTVAVSDHLGQVRDAVRNTENQPVSIVKGIVARRYMEPLSLNDVAAEVNLNPVYLSVLFKKETGTNFKDYLTGVRIDTAKSLLRKKESLAEVAEKVGYKDAKYFSKLFTRVVGVNPTQYRKLYN